MSEVKHKVLIVDDNATNRQVLLFLLKQYADDVEVAVNGVEAVEKAEQSQFDLIVMDCHMPVMDGLDACRLIRANEIRTGATPSKIVALTAYGSPENRKDCLEAGMNDFYVKPVSKGMVQQWFGPAEAAKKETETLIPNEERVPKHPGDLAAIEEAILQQLSTLGLSVKTVAAAATLLIHQLPDSCAKLHGAFAAKDRIAVQRIAHTLKGSVGTLTAHQPFQACLALDMLAKREDASWSEMSVQLAEIERWRPAFIAATENLLMRSGFTIN
ncbi:response regulator [Leeia sp. TBRC 13508]|uniref:Response regulator n=1 Tax=Leeia speluncae TaxID=2884804 RepID=A0ABS8D2R6_9NEIS|nr:response regulator [Leeia speluncae]MCB6182490.1 response regulator [Leeia speluncae]